MSPWLLSVEASKSVDVGVSSHPAHVPADRITAASLHRVVPPAFPHLNRQLHGLSCSVSHLLGQKLRWVEEEQPGKVKVSTWAISACLFILLQQLPQPVDATAVSAYTKSNVAASPAPTPLNSFATSGVFIQFVPRLAISHLHHILSHHSYPITSYPTTSSSLRLPDVEPQAFRQRLHECPAQEADTAA
jgi:hypothetical protein